MTKEEFAKAYEKLPVILSPKQYIALAKTTAYIDYVCRFENGKCQNRATEKCCCSNCNKYKGHFYYRFKDKKIKKVIINLFDEETGFWRKDIGCILPREYRSLMCIKHHCYDEISPLIQVIDDKLYYYVNNWHREPSIR